jgi:hypothetical protein
MACHPPRSIPRSVHRRHYLADRDPQRLARECFHLAEIALARRREWPGDPQTLSVRSTELAWCQSHNQVKASREMTLISEPKRLCNGC